MCKGSENPATDAITHYFADPFYQRQIGLNETFAAALQMREYLNTIRNHGRAMRKGGREELEERSQKSLCPREKEGDFGRSHEFKASHGSL